MIHDSILGTIGNTPIVRLSRIEPRGTLYAKLESFNPLGWSRIAWRWPSSRRPSATAACARARR
jgi:hypothetical protein